MIPISLFVIFILLMAGYCAMNILRWTTIIPLWLFTTLVEDLLINAIVTNLEYVDKKRTPVPYEAYLILQYLLLPLAILILIRMYIRLSQPLQAGLVLLGTLVFVAIERLTERLGIIEYRHWNYGYSALLWLFVICVSIVFYHFIESKSLKNGDPDYV